MQILMVKQKKVMSLNNNCTKIVYNCTYLKKAQSCKYNNNNIQGNKCNKLRLLYFYFRVLFKVYITRYIILYGFLFSAIFAINAINQVMPELTNIEICYLAYRGDQK